MFIIFKLSFISANVCQIRYFDFLYYCKRILNVSLSLIFSVFLAEFVWGRMDISHLSSLKCAGILKQVPVQTHHCKLFLPYVFCAVYYSRTHVQWFYLSLYIYLQVKYFTFVSWRQGPCVFVKRIYTCKINIDSD